MKYLQWFETEEQYNSFISGGFIRPNVSYVLENDMCYFYPDIPQVGDVAYWNGSSIQTVSLEGWEESMGIAVGVVVIPGEFLPDGKARMVALNQSNTKKAWGPRGTDISDLINYDRVPITDNAGSTTTGSNYDGFLPSDIFTGTTSFVDPIAKYETMTSNWIPSPYLSDNTLNPEYMKTIDDYNNVLSDFDGKRNTDILVGLGSDYEAANYAKDYTIDGVSGIDWYLPAMGELGVMLARLGKINEVIKSLGGVAIRTDLGFLWSSSECDFATTWLLQSDGGVNHITKSNGRNNNYYVRSFAMIDNSMVGNKPDVELINFYLKKER